MYIGASETLQVRRAVKLGSCKALCVRIPRWTQEQKSTKGKSPWKKPGSMARRLEQRHTHTLWCSFKFNSYSAAGGVEEQRESLSLQNSLSLSQNQWWRRRKTWPTLKWQLETKDSCSSRRDADQRFVWLVSINFSLLSNLLQLGLFVQYGPSGCFGTCAVVEIQLACSTCNSVVKA